MLKITEYSTMKINLPEDVSIPESLINETLC